MLYTKLCSYENLFSAYQKARQGKTKKHYILTFEKELEKNLNQLQIELITQTYKPKPLRTFIIRDPKTRKISKSRFRDRVIHHALINIIGSDFSKGFIYDSHANQIGKGTLKALERFDHFKRKASKNGTCPCYVLKADIRHYFEEVNHSVLISILRRKIKDEKVIWLVKQILSNISENPSGGGGERLQGMPLGNYTSQFFANVYLNELDQYVKHILKAKYYIRYVDDFVILSHSKQELELYKEKIDRFLTEILHLSLHSDKSKVLMLDQGIPFLGFRIFTHSRIIRKANLRKFQGKFREFKTLYKERQINREQVVEKLEGWMAYARQGNTYKYRRKLLQRFNKDFPIKNKSQIILSKKITNFFRKYYSSKVEFSVQKTLFLLRKGLSIEEIEKERCLKQGTVWEHVINLIEHGQLAVWNIMPKKKIVYLLQRIKDPEEPLKQIKERIYDQRITYDEIACVRAHMKMKEKIKKSNSLKHAKSH
ncbi:helix-turn-helix domain-containing protein [Candidatus Pacearchaeota archaeon]|nr:hypothetical protein [uncultured archaeon]MBS3089581.1 helix-turn-helix domain-containing protein [Candidatus Pacearchaeota archaeon]